MKILDIGGGTTLPVFYLASLGHQILSLDSMKSLTQHTNKVAQKFHWRLDASTHNLADSELHKGDEFDVVYSFCTIEHITYPEREILLQRAVNVLKLNGLMVLTFDFGENAPTENPIKSIKDIEGIIKTTGLSLAGNTEFKDTGERFVLDRKRPDTSYTFGSLFLKKV